MMSDRSVHKRNALSAWYVAGVRSGDEGAARGLIDLWGRRLMAHAVRLLGETEGARDAVQDAWIDIFRGLHGLADDDAFLPWALRIVSRKVARLIARRQKDRRLAAAARIEPIEAFSPPSDMASREEAQQVRRALGTLSADHRATVALFYLEDLTVPEVAEALGVPVGTVKTRLMHARRRLRAELEGDDNGQD